MIRKYSHKTIAAAMVATIVVSLSFLPSCEGRKMSNMKPLDETVEVAVAPDSSQAPLDSTLSVTP